MQCGTQRNGVGKWLRTVFAIPLLFLLFSVLISCNVSPIMEAPPERIAKEIKAEEKQVEVTYEEDSGEGFTSLTVGVNTDDKVLYSNHNITYEYFLLTTEYLSDRRDGSTITGLFTNFKIPSGSDGSRTGVDLGYFTQGKWRISIKAANSDGDILYVGSAETYITAGKKNSVDISMQENTEDVGRIQLDVMSLTVPLPRVVVTYTKVWNGDGEKTLLDTGADGKGLVMETLDNGYTTYKTPEIIMPAGAYWIKVQLWAGEDLFSGEVLDTYIVPRKTTTISGIFTITGLADFIRVNPDERYTFCEACERFEIPTGKMITGFHLLGSTGLVDFPYKNTTNLLQYLIPVYEDVSTYFNLSGNNELSLATEYPYKYAGFNTGYPDSPTAFSASLFAGTSAEKRNQIKGVYSPSTVLIGENAFEYSDIEEVRFGNINEIGSYAFRGTDSFSNFGETIFTNGITIGNGAFEQGGISYIDIPSGATVGTGLFKDASKLFRCSFYPTEVPENTFNGCTALTQINLNTNGTTIGDNAFKNCSALESISLPETLVSIGKNAFENCSGLKKTLSIGSKIKTIGTDAFKGCDTLDEIYIAVTCGDLEGEPWGLADSSKITYWAYKLFFNSNLPDDYEKAEGEEEFPMLRERFGELLPTPVADPKYRLIGYMDVVGNTLDGYEIPIPIIDGYALRGWFTDPASGAGEEVTQLTVNKIKANRTVYAHWVNGLITVVFSGGRGGNGDTGKSTQTYRMVRYGGYYGYIGEEDEEDDYASPLPTATIAGRDFLGWYPVTEPMIDDVSPDETSQSKLTAIVDETQVTSKKSHTLYAHYIDHRYTVEFNANLPTNADVYGTRNGTLVYSSYNTPESFTAVYNQPYNKRYELGKLTGNGYTGTVENLPDLNSEEYKLDNYYFCGWYLEPECTTRVYDNTRVPAQEKNGDTITLYAKWIGKDKTVTYASRIKDHPADTEYTELEIGSAVQRFTSPLTATDSFRSYFNKKVVDGKEMQIEYDSPFSFPLPIRTGYTFSAWWTTFDDATNKTGGNKLIDGSTIEGDVTEMTTPGDQKVYAEWIPNKYTVTFNANGGVVDTEEKTVTFDTKYGELPTPTRKGYTFIGWYLTTVRGAGYGYQNSEAYVTADTWVRTASDHTLYAGWSAVVVTEVTNVTDSTPINTTVAFNPVSNGGEYGESDNIASRTVGIKTVWSHNTHGIKDESGNWVNSSEPERIPNQTVTITTTNDEYLTVVKTITTGEDGTAVIDITTTESAIPGPQKIILKTITEDWTSGIINVSLNGALTQLTLSETDATVYIRNDITVTATLKCTDGNGYLHKSNNVVEITMDECDDKYSEYEAKGQDSGAPTVYFKAGYTVGVFSLKVTQPTSGLSTTATIRVEQPPATVKVEVGGTVGSFFDNVASVYGSSSTAKEQWLITGFRDWEGGDPDSSAVETTVTTTTRAVGSTNNTDHPIYLYPIKAAVFTSSSSRAGTYSSENIAFPTNVKYIGTTSSSSNYSSAKKVYIAGSSVEIAQYAFYNNTKSLEFKVAGSIYSVGSRAFYNCSSLYGITTTDFKSMKSIGSYAFYSAYVGTAVQLSSCSIGDYAFAYSKITSITSSTSGYYMCAGSNVSSASISSDTLSTGAFSGCKNLSSASFYGSTIGSSAFYNCSNLSWVSISWTEYIYSSAFYNCDSLSSISFTRVRSIGSSAFEDCDGLRSVSFTSYLTSLDSYAFYYCYGLRSVYMSSSRLSSIGSYAFAKCKNLSTITWSSSTTSIGSYAFSECTGLSGSLTVSPKNIGSSAFSGCTGITSLTLSASGVSVGSSGFSGCTSLSSVKFSSSSAITLGSSAFSGCSSLSTVDFLNMGSSFNSSSIGSSCWNGCQLRYVKLTQNCFPSGSGSWTGVSWTKEEINSEWTRYFKSPCISQYIHITRSSGGGPGWHYQQDLSAKGNCNGNEWSRFDGQGTNTTNWDESPASSHGALLPFAYCKIFKQWTSNHTGWWAIYAWGEYKVNYNYIGSVCSTCWRKISSSYKWSVSSEDVRESAYSTSSYCNDAVYPGSLGQLIPIP